MHIVQQKLAKTTIAEQSSALTLRSPFFPWQRGKHPTWLWVRGIKKQQWKILLGKLYLGVSDMQFLVVSLLLGIIECENAIAGTLHIAINETAATGHHCNIPSHSTILGPDLPGLFTRQ